MAPKALLASQSSLGRFLSLIDTWNLLAHIDRKQGVRGRRCLAQDKRDIRAFDARKSIRAQLSGKDGKEYSVLPFLGTYCPRKT